MPGPGYPVHASTARSSGRVADAVNAGSPRPDRAPKPVGEVAHGMACSCTYYGNDCGCWCKSTQRSPISERRWGIDRRWNVCGPTAPLATSSQVHGADTGAPGRGRTAYGAAYVAL